MNKWINFGISLSFLGMALYIHLLLIDLWIFRSWPAIAYSNGTAYLLTFVFIVTFVSLSLSFFIYGRRAFSENEGKVKKED